MIKPLRSAALLGAISVICLLVQMWTLADIANSLIHSTEITIDQISVFASCWLLRVFLLEIKNQLCVKASITLRTQIRKEILQKLLIAGPLRKNFGTDGELSTLVLEKVDALDGYISRYWPQQILVVISPILISIAVGYYSLLAAIIMLITAPLVIVFMVFVGHEASSASAKQLRFLTQMGGRFYDFILGLRTLRQFKALDIATEQLTDAAEKFKTSSFSVLKMAFLSTAVLELFSSLAIALVALYLGLGLIGELPWQRGLIPVEYQPALFILLLAPEFYAPLRQLGADYHAKAMATAAAIDILPIWNAPSKPVITGHQAVNWSNQSKIVLTDIRVNSGDSVRLKVSHLLINASDHWLISGPSGSGKTTLLQLICGFWPWLGNISIADKAFQDIDLAKWRTQLGYLNQKPEFLPGSIAENLRMAKPDATEQQLWDCLTQVGMADFVKALRNGLNQPLQDNAGNLSGGQQQRLALARLLLADNPIWLLDEPWVHLDPDNAKKIIDIIKCGAQGRTLLLVSHQTDDLDWLSHRYELQDNCIIAGDSDAKLDNEVQDV